jgi:hypothetical protein
MLAQLDQRGSFVGKSEPDALNLSRIIARAFGIGLDGDVLESGSLVARERCEIEDRVAARLRAHVIGHVGKTELGELGNDRIGGDLGALRLHLAPRAHGALNLDIC